MVFLLIRFLPWLLPVAYFWLAEGFFTWHWSWVVVLGAVLAINLIYFLILLLRIKKSKILSLFLYAEIFSFLGLTYVALLGSSRAVTFFLLAWSLIYFFYLEAVFHYFYQTKKTELIDLKHIVTYSNVLLLFLSTLCLWNFYIFLAMPAIWIALVILVVAWQAVFCSILLNGIDWKNSFIYASVIAWCLAQIVVALAFWPNSIYIIALMVALFYYIFSGLAVLHIQKKLNLKYIWQYAIFAGLVFGLVLITAKWF
ncbi:MAG: hypothetical protein WCL61_01555 [bacterium]